VGIVPCDPQKRAAPKTDVRLRYSIREGDLMRTLKPDRLHAGSWSGAGYHDHRQRKKIGEGDPFLERNYRRKDSDAKPQRGEEREGREKKSSGLWKCLPRGALPGVLNRKVFARKTRAISRTEGPGVPLKGKGNLLPWQRIYREPGVTNIPER